jgi:hypothetical protein
MWPHQVVLQNLPESSHASQLLSRQHHATITPLPATLPQPSSMHCKVTTYTITNSFRYNTGKKHGVGSRHSIPTLSEGVLLRPHSFIVFCIKSVSQLFCNQTLPHSFSKLPGCHPPPTIPILELVALSPKTKRVGGRYCRRSPRPPSILSNSFSNFGLTRRGLSDRPWPAFRLPSPRPWRSRRASACGWTSSGSGACRQPSPYTRRGPRS